MCKINIKTIRNEYENLSLLVEKENYTASEKDLVTRAKSISNEDILQIFSEQHGGVVDTITKNTDNAVFFKRILNFFPGYDVCVAFTGRCGKSCRIAPFGMRR